MSENAQNTEQHLLCHDGPDASDARLPRVLSDFDSGEVGDGNGVNTRPGRGCTPSAWPSIGEGGLLVLIAMGEAGLLDSLNSDWFRALFWSCLDFCIANVMLPICVVWAAGSGSASWGCALR